MSPDEPKGQLSGTPPQSNDDQQQRDAAANIIRSHIDSLYTPSVESVESSDVNPYDRTHADVVTPQADQWKEYHTAWQNYYQKYYEAYYTQQTESQRDGKESYFIQTPRPEPTESLSQDEALDDLRHQLLDKVQESAKKARKSRHFIPVAAALFVVLVFVFLQYNSFITGTVMAYVSPGSVNVQNIVIDPNDTVAVTQDPRLIIPKINVDVPVLYGVGSDYNSQMAAMQKGVAQFSIPGASAVPGEVGNVAIAGHSSNDLLEPGDYKFIFAQLEKLNNGDTIYANYNGVRYTYVVTGKQVVLPSNVAAVQYSGDKPIMTLITCTPVGTSKYRLLVQATQVSPDPSTAQKIASSTNVQKATTISGYNGPSVIQKLFGAK